MVRWRIMPVRKGPRLFPFQTRHIETASGRLAVFDEGTGPAIVFIHGLGGDFTHFEHVAPAFADRYRVIGVDMPGCGDSHKPGHRLSVRGHAKALFDLLDALDIKSATLVGHSAGGLVCATAAFLHPHRVEQLVLINSAGLRQYRWWTRLGARLLFRRPLVDAFLVLSAYAILKRVFAAENQYTRKFADDNIHRPREARLRHIAKVIADLLPDMMIPTLAQNAHTLDIPALIIWGAQDRLVPLAAVQRAAELLPAGRLEVLMDCGHMPIIEQPEATVSLLRSFFTPTRVPRLEAVP
jgi:pimeloyl-ACP methyl ester carboxylesterase